jgi:hypothetical protein
MVSGEAVEIDGILVMLLLRGTQILALSNAILSHLRDCASDRVRSNYRAAARKQLGQGMGTAVSYPDV